jgi:hypothetical protein
MNKEREEQITTAVDSMRIDVFNRLCLPDEDQTTAVAHMAAEFFRQTCVCLDAIYGSNHKLVSAHILLLLNNSLGSRELEIVE